MRKSKYGCSSPLYLEWNQGSREYQEDYFGVYSQNNKILMVVTDGMGGHSSGDLASRWAVEDLVEEFKQDQKIELFVKKGIMRVLEKMKASGKDMGCTMVLCLLEKENERFKLSYTWLGDSRLYLLGSNEKPTDNAKIIETKYNKSLWLLSDDDSFIWGFFLNNELTIDQLTQHPNKNQLEFSIHPRQQNVDDILLKRIRTLYLHENDKILMCTDGIWESYLIQSEMIDHLNEINPKKTIQSHLKKALREERFNDNGTYILAEVGEKILNQKCFPPKKKRRFIGSLFFNFLILLLFVAIFFVLIGKLNTNFTRSRKQSGIQTIVRENRIKKPETRIEFKKSREVFFVIRVGSFPNFEEAKFYSEKFRKMGYPVEISSPDPAEINPLYHVSIGQFDSLDGAEKQKEDLEKKENKKFEIKKIH